MSWFVGIALPLALYFGLALLPKAGAVRLFILSGLGISVLWAAFFLKIGDAGVFDTSDGVYNIMKLLGFSTALVLGGSMMVLKTRLPDTWPIWSWPVCVVLALVAVGLPILRMLTM